MKLPLLLLSGILCASSAFARIGDTEQSLEARITADRFAVAMRGDTAEKLLQKGPLKRFLNFAEDIEDAFEFCIYIKSANGERLSTTDAKEGSVEDGWVYSAVLLKGIVVAESYERKTGRSRKNLNPHEKKGLLLVNKSQFAWEELDKMKRPSGEELKGLTTYNFYRSDEKVFAKFERNHAIFIRKELDEKLREKRSVRNAEIDEENRSALQLSIAGF